MKAISPIVLPSNRISSDPSAGDGANTATPAARTDFAGTLQGVTRPAPKVAGGKNAPETAERGESLPQAGKPAPAPQAPAATATPVTPDKPAVSAPLKGKQLPKALPAPARPLGSPDPLSVSLVATTPLLDTRGGADSSSRAPSLSATPAGAGGGAPLATPGIADAALGNAPVAVPPSALPGQANDAPAAAAQAGDPTRGLFHQAPPDAASMAAEIPVPPTVVAGALAPPPSPASLPAEVSPDSASAPQATAEPIATVPSAQATPSLNLTPRAGQVGAGHATNPKGTTASPAKVRAPSASETRHAQTSPATPPEEGEGTDAPSRQTAASLHTAADTSNATANGAGIDTRTSSAGEPSQVSGQAMQAKGPDAAPDAQAGSSDALSAGPATSAAAGAANNSPSTPNVANLSGAAPDKHGASRSDAPGNDTVDPRSALQSVSPAGLGNAPDAPAAGPTFKLGPSVDSSEFGQGVANQVSMMVDSNITSAKLQVSPPALGPIEVRIALQGDHASVQFTSHSAVTREALADSTPKLRDMLTSQGFGQVSVDISHRSFQERPSNAQAYDWGGNGDGAKTAPGAAVASLPSARVARSALDAYA